jgi:purine-binding chemotaxis protein CheW
VAELRLVCFELAHQELGVPISRVRETLIVQPITRVFLTTPALAGVFNLRGEIVPAIDLGVLLGAGPTAITPSSRIVITSYELGTAGLIVDRMLEQRRIEEPLEPPPANLAPAIAQLFAGIATTPTGTVRVLDAGALIEVEALRALRAGTPD